MNSTTAPQSAGLSLPRHAPAAARTTLQLLQRLRHGSLTLQLPDGTVHRFGGGAGPLASMRLANWNVFGAALRSGDIGFAESYIAGDWSTPQLSDLLRLLIANREALEDVVYGSWIGRLAYRLRHLLNRNSKTNSRRNIHAHYDLGNAFYGLWLDETWNYSSALYEQPGMDMVAAQHAKVRRALRMASVQPGDRVLEIGCGWGALAEKALTEFGAAVTGVTLSTEQLAFAQKRNPGADLRLQDYRDIGDAPFDAICSIEMVEAVGREYWDTYFNAVSRLLKPGGRACIQSITIRDDLFERYVAGTDFIQQYIFPGGCLPSPSQFRAAAERAGLQVVDQFHFGPDYAQTLRVWRQQFLLQQDRVLQQGFDQRFLRTWEFYLAYCEAAFDEGNTDVVQFTLRKPA
ncbi:cyclopropane-fatty-acyl-phospholipid synthase family protein [Hydrogenophaga pseudoflava]|uniref:cyclopropane-fatty-acyl-phospholipid synthase family protein n=1 Tax=Hydrogenophaga pseudoflava TaxID=47421 RepID=UPI0027E4D737|nr:cyclopropane-fatty-acyl-phospholipid synthase family protein [Hydrogenophaga pseudoflava]MDQ7747013.1 cyclopropane-fatty-acyl-phospholipid synthase family protein [Hydrogenophaga pseudoflava]